MRLETIKADAASRRNTAAPRAQHDTLVAELAAARGAIASFLAGLHVHSAA
jgi:hypothetical protein